MVQILFSVTPNVSPTFFCQRVKGRLQHALRQCGTPVDFSRKVSFRSLGENTSEVVENYIQGQVGKADFADPRFRETMRRFTVVSDNVRLAEPSESNSGRYWYNLHVVLVVAARFRITDTMQLERLRDTAFTVAEEAGHRIAALSVMPDHVHMALRGDIERSPEEIALAFQNRLARAAGCRVWQDGFYVGTFSEYDLDVIRRIASQS
jgi:REP element-mobilizing transposase RayT